MSGMAMHCDKRRLVVRRRFVVTRRLVPWALASSLAIVSNAGPAESQPDRIVFVSERDGNSEIYTVNVDGTDLDRLTTNAAIDEFPAWSPDGQLIAFQSNRTGSFEIYVMGADGSNVVRRTFSASDSKHPTWSPDGNTIAYSTDSNGSVDLWKVAAVSGTPSLLFSTPGQELQPDWSPDGARLALTSDWYAYDFVRDIFLVNTDGSGFTGLTDPVVIDHVDFAEPAWSPDGATLSLAMDWTIGIEQYFTRLCVMNDDGSNLRILAQAMFGTRSSWAPDGQRIVYTADGNVVWINADGGASDTIITNGRNADWNPAQTTTSAGSNGPAHSGGVRVLTSPSREPVRFAVGTHDPGDKLDIYDVTGRLVRHVPLGTSSESQIVVWDWRQGGCAPGVYFARFCSVSAPIRTVRFVVLR